MATLIYHNPRIFVSSVDVWLRAFRSFFAVVLYNDELKSQLEYHLLNVECCCNQFSQIVLLVLKEAHRSRNILAGVQMALAQYPNSWLIIVLIATAKGKYYKTFGQRIPR